MVIRIASTDSKIKSILDGADHLMYLVCNHNAQRILQQAPQNRYIGLNRDYTYGILIGIIPTLHAP